MALALTIGMLVSIQPAMNVILARAVESSYGAAVISHLVALLSILLVVAVIGAGKITPQALTSIPWWVYLAGVIGMFYVASGIVIAPVTGTLVYFIFVIAGQLIGSVLADHFGILGLQVREISTMRLAGLGLVLTGAFMVSKW